MSLIKITSADKTAARPTSDDSSRESIERVDQLPVQNIAVGSLHSGFFRRGTGTDPAHVQMLSEVASFSELPPILVQKNTFRIIDGTHRFEAAKQRSEITMRARIVDCSDNDAFILAVKANTLHGLPLSRADRVLGAKRILGWHPDWSDRAIGIATGLSAKTIAAIRRESADERPQFGKRLGRDGKRRPVTAIEGRKRAAEFITARPDASLREIARETDVSLGTVQDVRARMRSGLDPLTPGRVNPPLKAADDPATEPEPSRPVSFPSRLGPRHARRNTQQPSWSGISNKLADDPSLKYTEGGRAFIRWMIMHGSNTGQWKEFVDSIPSHWLSEVSIVAEQASEDWRDFAEHLKNRQDKAVLAGGRALPLEATVQMDSQTAPYDLDRAVTQFCLQECGSRAERKALTDDGQEMHSREIAEKMAARGWLGISIPEEYGGNGGGLLGLCTFLEVTSREMAPIEAFTTSAIVGFAYQRFGTEAQKRQILTGIAAGRVEALSLSEAGAGSDLSAVSCRAELVDGEFIVNGHKAWCSNAHLADHVLLLVRTSDKPGTSGSLTMLQVPTDAKGLSVHAVESIAGRQLNDLHLESCRVPESAVVGIPGEAWLQTMTMLSFERLVIAATMIGVAQRTLDDIIRYVRHRTQFNGTLGSFQTVRHRLADLLTEVECSRMLVQRAATTADPNLRRLSPLETSMAKLKATETAKRAAIEGMQLTGAYGTTAESDMPQHLRDSVLATVYGGATEIQREIISRSIFP